MPNATDEFIIEACKTGIDAFRHRKISVVLHHANFAVEFAYVSNRGSPVLKLTVTKGGRRGDVVFRATVGGAAAGPARTAARTVKTLAGNVDRYSSGAPTWAIRLENCLKRGTGTGQINNAHGLRHAFHARTSTRIPSRTVRTPAARTPAARTPVLARTASLSHELRRHPSNTIDAINDSVLRTGFPVPHPHLRPHGIVPYEERWLTGDLPAVIGRTPEIDWHAYDRRQLSQDIENNIRRMRANRLARNAARRRGSAKHHDTRRVIIRYPAAPPDKYPTVVQYKPYTGPN